MKRGKAHIKEFRISVSGLTKAEGRRFGELVAKQLTDAAKHTNGVKSISDLSIRVRSDSRSVDRLATDVTRHIRRRLN